MSGVVEIATRYAVDGDAQSLKSLLNKLAYRPYLANPEVRTRLYLLGQNQPTIIEVLRAQDRSERAAIKTHYARQAERASLKKEGKKIEQTPPETHQCHPEKISQNE